MRKDMFLNKLRGEIKLTDDFRSIVNTCHENVLNNPKVGFIMY